MKNIKMFLADKLEDLVYWLDSKADLGTEWGVRLNGLADRLWNLQHCIRASLPARF